MQNYAKYVGMQNMQKLEHARLNRCLSRFSGGSRRRAQSRWPRRDRRRATTAALSQVSSSLAAGRRFELPTQPPGWQPEPGRSRGRPGGPTSGWSTRLGGSGSVRPLPGSEQPAASEHKQQIYWS